MCFTLFINHAEPDGNYICHVFNSKKLCFAACVWVQEEHRLFCLHDINIFFFIM